ncbi:MAG: class I SAM-dependent methyltransferase [Thermoleophilaceae bacterium]|nr:class I SAM-dependent methyltransferase [Thermoleophilaceae bacterium]
MPRLLRALRTRLASARRAGSRLFERALGIDTAGIVELAQLDAEGFEREGYEGSGWLDLRRMLRPGEVKPDDVFLDLGSGKGRVLMLAARYPFARVIGVELSERLNAIARRNLEAGRRRRRCKQVELITSDVLDYEIPDDATVVYMYNPFRGATFQVVIAKLIASVDRRPRTVRLIYLNPKEHDRLKATGRFRLERKAGRLRLRRSEAARSYIRLYALEAR